MKDDELERLLAAYRPSGPPRELRARVMSSTVDTRRTWPWVVAAAALLLLTVGLQTATGRLARTVVLTDPAPVSPEVSALTEALGGGEDARRAAEMMIAIDRAAEASMPVGTAGREEVSRD